MKTRLSFLNKENSADAPLLSPRKSKTKMSSSSSYQSNNGNNGNGAATATTTTTRGPLKAILMAPLSAALSCQAPTITDDMDMDMNMFISTSTCSTVPSPVSTPNPSPQQTRRELDQPKDQPPACRHTIAEEMLRRTRGEQFPCNKPCSRGRKDPSYRQRKNIVSPTSAMALGRRVNSLPTAFSPPSLSHSPETKRDNASSRRTDGDGGIAIKKTRSEGTNRPGTSGTSGRHNNEAKKDHANVRVGQQQRNLVPLKSPQSSPSSQRQTRARTNTDPGELLPPTIIAPTKEFKSPDRTKTTNSKSSRTSAALANKKKSPTKSGPVDLDDTLSSEESSYHPTKELLNKENNNDDKSTSRRSAPAESELHRGVIDTERLLSQMGMNVTEEDYCIEGEYDASRRRSASKSSLGNNTNTTISSGSASYDCNYNHALDDAYEDSGVERRLVVMKQPPGTEACARGKLFTRPSVRSIKKLVRFSVGNGGNTNTNSEDRVSNTKASNNNNNNNYVLKTKVLSILQGNRKSAKKNNVPDQISLATTTPTTPSDDQNNNAEEDDPMTVDDVRLMHKWQSARVRAATTDGIEAQALSLGRRKTTVEDMLSITSSCDDKTTLVDNRNRKKKGEHRRKFSF